MDPFLVHDAAVVGPATHAIVIGVSAYPHLIGGTGPLSAHHEGMTQLTSASPSARSVASWLIESLHDPAKPLATVALLTAEDERRPFRNARTGADHLVEPATMANVKRALRAWAGRGASEDDRLIFYFCGHGIAGGTEVSLLLSDYGEHPDNPMDGAVDFGGMLRGLEAKAAREQCFFVDACRTGSEIAVAAVGYLGDPVFIANARNLPIPAPPPRLSPVYYSTVPGHAAYGYPDRPSPFAEALILGLKGAGSDDNDGEWRVSTTGLKLAIDSYLERAFGPGTRRAQVPATDNLSTFYLHSLEGPPVVDVFVGCRPEQANAAADLCCLSGGVVQNRRGPAEGEWKLSLQSGQYEFVADFAAGPYRRATRSRYVSPPYRRVPLEVSR
jgi:hypothetical protein